MSFERHGERIRLVTDSYGKRFPEYIRGHVTDAEAVKVMEDWGIDHEIDSIQHTYARWTKARAGADWETEFTAGWRRGPGAFPVTEIVFVDGIHVRAVSDKGQEDG